MPRIELVEPVYFAAQDPYHWSYDNLPLYNIIRRENLINLALDNVLDQMRNAIGTQGSLSNRLNQSINADGSLKSSAIDNALHSIEEHEDTDDYVRMTKAESDKLNLIAAEATNLSVQVDTDGSSTVLFDAGVIEIQASDSVSPIVVSPNILKFELGFPVAAAHQHYYSLTPTNDDLIDPDYINFKVNSMATAYIDGSLRVYINGVRIFEDVEVYVPGSLTDDPWTLLSFTSDATDGTFALSAAISDSDIIKIDFDISFV